MNLKTKLQAGFGALALIATLIGAMVILSSIFFHQSFENILHIHLPIARVNLEVEGKILQVITRGKKSLREGKGLQGIGEVNNLKQLLDQEKKRVSHWKNERLFERYNHIRKYFDQYEKIYNQALILYQRKQGLKTQSEQQASRILQNLEAWLALKRKIVKKRSNIKIPFDRLEKGQEMLALAKEYFWQGRLALLTHDKAELEKWEKFDFLQKFKQLLDKGDVDIALLNRGMIAAEEYSSTVGLVADSEIRFLDLMNQVDILGHKIQLEAEAGKQEGWKILDETHRATDLVAGRMKWLVILPILIAIGLAWFMGIHLSKRIFQPIPKLVEFFASISQGDLSSRIQIKTSDEIQTLAEAANLMAERLEKKIRVQAELLDITRTMGSFNELDQMLDHLLEDLLKIFHSQLGAFYLFDQSESCLKLKAARGAGQELFSRLEIGEGLIGLAAKSRDIQVLNEIPENTRFILKCALGEGLPNNMVNLPFYFHDHLLGVLCLAGFYPITEDRVQILHIIATQMGITIANAQAYGLVRQQAEELRQKGEELEVQNEELQSQAEELAAQTEELSMQQKELETKSHQLEEANNLKSEFLANMSHELRTPLNSILSFCYLLLDRIPGELNEEQEKQVKIIARSGKNLLQLIDDILDLSRVEAGQIEINNQEFQPGRLIDEIREAIEPMVWKKGLKLRVKVEKNLPTLYSDQRRLNQILLNLVNNALKFTSEGEIGLEVRAVDNNQFIQFIVRDTGIGIKPEDQEVIFQEFRQIDGSPSRTYAGAGLGLAIAQKLTRLLKGKIALKSESAQGSLFTVTIPVKPIIDSDQEIIEYFTEKEMEEVNIKGVNILVIDADPVASKSLINLLKREKYIVNKAMDAKSALRSLTDIKPDLIILDPNLRDGFKLLEKIKDDPISRDIPVIILTGKKLTTEQRSRLGQNKIIRKGTIKKDALLRKIRESCCPSESDKKAINQGQAIDQDQREIIAHENKIILVVEDNPDNLYASILALQSAGYIPITARSGPEALQKALKEIPDLILMDIQIPGLDGFEVTRQLTKIPSLSKIPVIALTAYAMPGDREKALQAGCVDYLAKPCPPEELVKRVRLYL